MIWLHFNLAILFNISVNLESTVTESKLKCISCNEHVLYEISRNDIWYIEYLH